MVAPGTITVEVDQTEFSAALAELESLQALPEFRERFLSLFDSGAELFRLENGPTAGATVTVLLKPTDRLVDFLAAMRASESDAAVVEESHE